MITRISDRVKILCEKCGTHVNIQFQTYCPPVLNNPYLYQLFSSAAKELLGPENVEKLSTHSMGSEDFGCYTEKIPGLLIRLGMGTQSPTLHGKYTEEGHRFWRQLRGSHCGPSLRRAYLLHWCGA